MRDEGPPILVDDPPHQGGEVDLLDREIAPEVVEAV